MTEKALNENHSLRELFGFFGTILGPEKSYYWLAAVYGVGISALTLALPISVQMLVNTVANTGLTTPLVVLSTSLFVLLLTAALLNALRIHVTDLFQRRFYARMVSEIALRSIYALNPFFHDLNKGSLFNRYFDIIIVQKSIPQLLIGGFTVVIQAVFGFILVSLYHPLFLVFNLIIALLIWGIWLIWGGRAIRSAVQVSHKKHAAAAWLEGLGGSNGFFKSERHIAEALGRTDAVTEEYINAHVKHFRHHFAQAICFLVLYASASAGLLGLGGWLVIQGQLSLGQLVAAELVLTGVFYGLSQFGTYLAHFYELCGALDELSLFYGIEQEEADDLAEPFEGDASIEFVGARGDARGHQCTLDFTIRSGARVLGAAETHGQQRELTSFLKRHSRPTNGYIALGGNDINGVQAHALRQQIIVLDRPNAIEMTIREYLRLSGEGASSHRILEALRTVGLEVAIAQLEDGLDTRVAPTGWPLTITETMQLKLAAAIIANPRVLVLGQLFDTMPDDLLERSMDSLQEDGQTTIIYFSARPRDLAFDTFLYLGYSDQYLFGTFEELCEYSEARLSEVSGLGDREGASDGSLVPAM
ncbi:MAG: ABC transporter ATP-binding protein [Woeseiaceae bacterium]|jgi:putative ABC transport system ATP-binding protein|nr:ABC transporter ATP-binding protein [Woeseiaceae bacterium]